jgi:fatty-acyl-CoA synthase
MTATRTHNSTEVRCTTVGFELPNVEIKIVSPETGAECETGQQGEICCRGYNVMKGYYKNEEATRKAIDKDGFLHSGDLAVKTEDGFYKITGRIKDMIIRGGENIYPREIENFLYKLPQIEAVEVAGVPSPKYGEQVGAFIKVKKGYTLTEEEVTDFCLGQIAKYKIPKYIFFVNEYPMTASGKIQKYKLSEMSHQLASEKNISII